MRYSFLILFLILLSAYSLAYEFEIGIAESTNSVAEEVEDYIIAEVDSYAPEGGGNKRIFYLGETAEIQIRASTNTVLGAEISFDTTISNDGTLVGTYNTKNITLTLTEPGYYEVRVTASADGFLDGKAVTRFTVIGEVPEAREIQFICNSNGRCDSEIGETSANCAWDCPSDVQIIADDPITAKLGIEQIIEPTPITQPLPIPEPTSAPTIEPTPEPTPKPTIEPILEPIPAPKPLIAQKAIALPLGMSLGSAVCVFNGFCATSINFAVFAIALILGVAFLKFKKGVLK